MIFGTGNYKFPVRLPRMAYPWEHGKTIEKSPFIYQIREVNRMDDNDIKYRFNKTTNGITPENLYKLETISNYNRDKKVIKEIRKEVEDYEKKIKERAEKLESERLKEGNTKR